MATQRFASNMHGRAASSNHIASCLRFANHARTIALGALCFALLFALAALSGCSSNTTSSGNTVTDVYGRNVSVPAEVKSIATVGSGARTVVYAGAEKLLIAITEMDTPASATRPYTEAQASVFASLPTTSNGNALNETTVDTEALMALKPDAIVSSRSKDECEELQKVTGIPVIGVTSTGDLFGDAVYNSITAVGKLCGTGEHAEKVVSALRGWESDLDKRTKDIAASDRKTVYVGGINYKGSKGLCWTYSNYAPLQAINTPSVADNGTNGSREISVEDLGTWNPDVVFLNMANKSLIQNDINNYGDFLNQLTAFATGEIYSQPSFNYNGTNIEIGICDAYYCGKVLYPAAFADVDMEKIYTEILTTLLDTDNLSSVSIKAASFTKVGTWK